MHPTGGYIVTVLYLSAGIDVSETAETFFT